jgi:DNA-binding PadR family transcriptional regulator
MDPESLLPLNPNDYLILFTLVAGERHGYGIVKEVEKESRGRIRIDPANLYRSMKRLTRDGLVKDADCRPAAEAQGERRRYYAITDFGRRVVTLEASRLAELVEAGRDRKLIPESVTDR